MPFSKIESADWPHAERRACLVLATLSLIVLSIVPASEGQAIEADSSTEEMLKRWEALSDEEADQLTIRHLEALMAAVHHYYREHNNTAPPPALPNPDLPPEKRLSGLVLLLPYLAKPPSWGKVVDARLERFRLEQRQRKLARRVFQSIDLTKAWDDPVNLKAARTVLPMLLAPKGGPARDARGYATSHFAFVRGLNGEDNGMFPLKGGPPEPQFRPTEQAGLAQINSHLGPWIAAGPSTSRHVYHPSARSDAPTFGSRYEGGWCFAACYISVSFLDIAETDQAALPYLVWREPTADSLQFRDKVIKYRTAAEWKAARQAEK